MGATNNLELESESAERTERIGELIGVRLKGGEIIELTSDLGGGKTTFVRGLARGLGSNDHVSSPTFKISNIYKSKDLSLLHFDFYRLADPGLMANELQDIVGDPKAVLVIEWADVLKHVLPERRLTIEFNQNGDGERQLMFNWPKELQYVMEKLC